jgi:hypothetical protein
MAVSELINLSSLLDDAKCFDLVRQHRWPQGVRGPGCDSEAVIRNGRAASGYWGSYRHSAALRRMIENEQPI